MILDNLQNAERYFGMHPLFAEAFKFLRELPEDAFVGRYELSGGAYAMVQEYVTKPVKLGKFEAHRRFIDIQFIARGNEGMEFGFIDQFAMGEYLAEKDFLTAVGDGQHFKVRAGDFAIFFPSDVHMPGVVAGRTPGPVRKVVVKVPVE